MTRHQEPLRQGIQRNDPIPAELSLHDFGGIDLMHLRAMVASSNWIADYRAIIARNISAQFSAL